MIMASNMRERKKEGRGLGSSIKLTKICHYFRLLLINTGKESGVRKKSLIDLDI